MKYLSLLLIIGLSPFLRADDSSQGVQESDFDGILELIDDSDELSHDEPQYRKKKKTYRFVVVKESLTTKNLRVCNNALLNNVTITGAFTACGVNVCQALSSISTSTTIATPCNIASTPVARDATGSFVATTIGLMGTSLINYSTSACSDGVGFLFAPTNTNTVLGINAGNNNTLTGAGNVAVGNGAGAALSSSTDNVLVGLNAGSGVSATGGSNVVVGPNAGTALTTGSVNVLMGPSVGNTITTGAANICIGNGVGPLANTNGSCFIGSIRGVTTTNANAVAVLVDSNNQLGTVSSSARVKRNIQDMGAITEDIYKLRPVIFNYIQYDNDDHVAYGLIAEEVEKIYPGIVVKDKDGLPETIQYHYLPVMMLNEQQKDHERINQLVELISAMRQEINDLKARG